MLPYTYIDNHLSEKICLMKKLSLIMPCYNEEKSLPAFDAFSKTDFFRVSFFFC